MSSHEKPTTGAPPKIAAGNPATRGKHNASDATGDSALPPYDPRFIGRVDDLFWLHEALQDPTRTAVCGLAGLAGIGKTATALAFAHAFAQFYPGGRHWLPQARSEDLQRLLRTLADGAGGPEDASRSEIAERVRMTAPTGFPPADAQRPDLADPLARRLEQRGTTLVILDDPSDEALQATEQAPWPHLAPHLHLLATARQLPADAAYWLTLGELPTSEAVELLARHRSLDIDEERAATRRIVRRIGGFPGALTPLGLSLAANPDLSVAELATHLATDPLGELERLGGHAVVAALDQEVQVLDAASRDTLEYVSLLAPDHIPIAWLEQLAADDPLNPDFASAAGTVSTLQGHALLGPVDDADPPRLAGTYPLLQQVVRRRMDAATTAMRETRLETLVRERVATHLTRLDPNPSAAATRMPGREKSGLPSPADADVWWELPALAALGQVWRECDRPAAGWLLHQVGRLWNAAGDGLRAETALRDAWVQSERETSADMAWRVDLLRDLAGVLSSGGQIREAQSLLHTALDYQRRDGASRSAIAATSVQLGVLLTASAPDLAEEALREARQLLDAEAAADPAVVTAYREAIVSLLWNTDRQGQAEPLFRELIDAEEARLPTDDPRMGFLLHGLARLLLELGRNGEADALFARAQHIDPAFGPPVVCEICNPPVSLTPQ